MDVVAAVLVDAHGRLLVAQRPLGKADGGLWEFPGGKIEPGEAAHDALARELREELGIEVTAAARFMRVRRERAHGPLILHAWRVSAWCGEPVAHEHAALRWIEPAQARELGWCEADGPIVRALQLPANYAITPAPSLDRLPEFYRTIEAGLDRGLRLLQWRAPGLAVDEFSAIGERLCALARAHGARLIVNADPALARAMGADGVHLSATRLRALDGPLKRADGFLVAASCHDRAELERAQQIGADFVVVSPVAATASHPLARPLGWDGLHALLEHSDLPAYALGGVASADLALARAHGAIGVAGISAFW